MRAKRTLRLIPIVVHSLSVALALTATADDWPYYQHDAAHSGGSTATVNPTLLSLAWSAPTGYFTPVVVGDTVYATNNGEGTTSPTTISSFALANGAINWSYTGYFDFPSQASVGGGFVTFVGSTFSSSSLYVLDATTGTLRYTVPIVEGVGSLMPTVVQDPVSGNVTAFVADGSHVSAVLLGPVSGSVLWTQTGGFGGSSIPTVVSNSIVLAGPGQYYAFDRSTGAENHFHTSAVSGGGGTTVAYDAARQQFYVREDYDQDPLKTLSAYHYTDNSHITLLWQRTGAGVGVVGSVAIGPNGNVYSAGYGVIWELDPTTGATLRSISGSFANGLTPALSNGVLWVFSEFETLAYDLGTLQLLRALPGSRGSSITAYDSPGALTDGHFLLDQGRVYGIHVYAVPIVMPQSAFSRKTHGAVGTFDVLLPLAGNVGVECRSGGAANDYQIIINFATTVTVGSASVTSGTGSVSTFVVSGSQVTVNLTGVTNAQKITVTLFDVNDGAHMGNTPVSMGILVGDVDGNATVNASDVCLSKAQAGQVVDSSNFRADVSAGGAINATDVSIVKANLGTGPP